MLKFADWLCSVTGCLFVPHQVAVLCDYINIVIKSILHVVGWAFTLEQDRDRVRDVDAPIKLYWKTYDRRGLPSNRHKNCSVWAFQSLRSRGSRVSQTSTTSSPRPREQHYGTPQTFQQLQSDFKNELCLLKKVIDLMVQLNNLYINIMPEEDDNS
ncbi:hypothetical protein C8J57DRAFT_1245155 [Mycena rebaudengoi]|nr:hypothetical protein C8J57DRAFT_1245155 [Mycena rebaudengoi]